MPNGIHVQQPDARMVWLVCVALYVSFGPTQAPFYTPSLYDNARLLQLFSLSALALMAFTIPSLREGIVQTIAQARGFVRFGLLSTTLLALMSALRACFAEHGVAGNRSCSCCWACSRCPPPRSRQRTERRSTTCCSWLSKVLR